MAKNLSAVNAYPIETGMRKDIAVELNVKGRVLDAVAKRTCYSWWTDIRNVSAQERTQQRTMIILSQENTSFLRNKLEVELENSRLQHTCTPHQLRQST